MVLDQVGIDFIINNEGKRNRAYYDDNGFGTIGVGHKIKEDESYLKNANLDNSAIMDLFMQDIIPVQNFINTTTENWDNPITQGQFNALCDFCFQYGINLSNHYPNTYRAIITGNKADIVYHLMQFTNENPADNDGKLLNRRQKEIEIFNN